MLASKFPVCTSLEWDNEHERTTFVDIIQEVIHRLHIQSLFGNVLKCPTWPIRSKIKQHHPGKKGPRIWGSASCHKVSLSYSSKLHSHDGYVWRVCFLHGGSSRGVKSCFCCQGTLLFLKFLGGKKKRLLEVGCNKVFPRRLRSSS